MKGSPAERRYLETTRVGRLATADAEGRPHVVPVCFVVLDDSVVTPIDEKPKSVQASRLRRIQDITDNARVALVCDHWTEDWDNLGWVQIRGTARIASPEAADHGEAVAALREKYTQYETHALDERPLIWIEISQVLSWGRLHS